MVERSRDAGGSPDESGDEDLAESERQVLEAATAADPLAAVVAKPRADAVVDALQAEGVYDDRRRVREYDDERLAVPVTAAPERTTVQAVVRQVDPDRRSRGLVDLLAERGWSGAAIDRAPGSWAVIGDVVVVTLDDDWSPEREATIGEALLDLHGEADTVLATEGVSGRRREPSVRTIAGSGDTETVHVEHGTRYAMDLAAVMFSPGNKAERRRMGAVVAGDAPPAPATGRDGPERVFDMFAGIGYFALPMARAGATVTATEINPTAFRFLLENAALNDVTDRIRAYRADCRDVAGTIPAVDRVVMGYYDAYEYLDSALRALAPGGVVHLHEATPEPLLWDRPVDRLESAAVEQDRTVDVVARRRVKTHSEGVVHVVVDARVR